MCSPEKWHLKITIIIIIIIAYDRSDKMKTIEGISVNSISMETVYKDRMINCVKC